MTRSYGNYFPALCENAWYTLVLFIRFYKRGGEKQWLLNFVYNTKAIWRGGMNKYHPSFYHRTLVCNRRFILCNSLET